MSNGRHDSVETVRNEQEPVIVLNADCECVGTNEQAREIHRRSREELEGLSAADMMAEVTIEAGRTFEQVLAGEIHRRVDTIIRGDGTLAAFEAILEPETVAGEDCVKATIKDSWEVDSDGGHHYPKLGDMSFTDISNEKLDEIMRNVRVNAPGGEMALNTIILDITAGHNDIHQYKQGALSLHKAVDERLQEEEQLNADSATCDVLREVKDSAFGLYRRTQTGDEEYLN